MGKTITGLCPSVENIARCLASLIIFIPVSEVKVGRGDQESNLQDECHHTSLPVSEAEAGQRRSGDQWQPYCHGKISGSQTASVGRCVWYGT